MKILFLDIATRTGWASGWSNDTLPMFGAVELPSESTGDMGQFAYTYRDWLIDMIRRHRPAEDDERHGNLPASDRKLQVVFECPVMPATTNIITCRRLYGLALITEEVCYGECPCHELNLTTIKKMVAGHGHAEKKEVQAAINALFGLELRGKKQEDEADAIAGWMTSVHRLDVHNAMRWGMGALAEKRAPRPRKPKPAPPDAPLLTGTRLADQVAAFTPKRPRRAAAG